MNTDYDGRQVVGIDLHRRRTVIVQQSEVGDRLGVTRIDNDPFVLAEQVAGWGEAPQVVLEATYGWYWAADVLAEAGAQVHLAHPLGVKGFAYRRVKNDVRDASDLADLLRMGRLPEAWIAPPATRELRELVRHRAKLVAVRSGLKAGVHAVLAKCGVSVPMTDLFGVAGQQLLTELRLPDVYAGRIASLRRLIDAFGFEIDLYAKMTGARLSTNPGYVAVQAIDGVGPILAGVFVAEIGEVHRFTRPEQLCSWAGLTPRHRESDTKVRRGRITKQGSTLVRWAAVEAVQRVRRGPIAATRARIGEHRGANIGKVAAARKLLTLVYYGLRDGHIRCLARSA
ncbi:IS110 family transposase [Micromonospora sp. 4G57]|uniref:IS110 family transposase n=1 Tax=Micromonospora sicca TaxID=2202420 RepID=A0ABU5JNM8_9ACTN|nr:MULTISPECIES: IS110 family transposase [unclassified Micromonospora]MDZ5447209.1 IS110 family transposase [Micromonospora sp. 4G57]MDZ5493924.1 IS110 family transposase [Micromonospora sp. 4G53]